MASQRYNSHTEFKVSVAKALLDANAINFNANSPITLKSGIVSPIYIDSRVLLSCPKEWRVIIECFRLLMNSRQLNYDVLAGVASGGIPHCSVLSYLLKCPSVFVRKETKNHGLQKEIEGLDVNGKLVILVEDNITTGGSSIEAIQKLRNAKAKVTDVLSIISYGFNSTKELFDSYQVRVHTLTSFDTLLYVARNRGLITENEFDTIGKWSQIGYEQNQ